jgi:hypothetical protein
MTRTIKTTYKHSVARMKNFSMLNLVAYKVATKLSRDTKFVSFTLLYVYLYARDVISCAYPAYKEICPLTLCKKLKC